MDLEPSEDQALFVETARRFLAAEAPLGRTRSLLGDGHGFDPAVYRKAAELGWLSPLVPEALGGGSVSGRPVEDLALLAGEMARVLYPGPVLETNLVAAAIARLGPAEPRKEHLAVLVTGEATASPVLPGAGDGWSSSVTGVSAEPTGDGGWRLSGSAGLVPHGASVDLLLVVATAAGAGAGLFLVPRRSSGVEAAPLETLDLTRPLAAVELSDVEVPAASVLGQLGSVEADVEWLALLAGALQCAETVGAMDACLEMTLDYARSRRAFGRPIGSFQAIKHRLADMVLWLEWSRAAAAAAVGSLAVQSPSDPAEAVSVAKAVIGEHSPGLVRSAVQIHGGIGYTWEHDVHLYLRRVEANAVLYGTTDFHRNRLAGMIGFPEPAGR